MIGIVVLYPALKNADVGSTTAIFVLYNFSVTFKDKWWLNIFMIILSDKVLFLPFLILLEQILSP